MTEQATCFVIQGFGKKTDYTNGRVLDLDASYEVIKEAVEAAGVKCVRADEIMHSGIIDVPMYEYLLNADVVIADLSTYNVNAAFELGVRYALKPHTTIVLADDQFKNPFDLNHVVIRNYCHLGEQGMSFREARRLIEELKVAIQGILLAPKVDSPVYTFLPELKPPVLGLTQLGQERGGGAVNINMAPAEVVGLVGEENPSAKAMMDAALKRIGESEFSAARTLLDEVRKLRPADSFVLQQLALSTYKSKQPSIVESLNAAQAILRELSPETTNNPETLGLWGAVHKRLWEECAHRQCLDESITAYERGFYLKQDHYNGINLAYLLDVRALEFLKIGNQDDAVADHVAAKRVRNSVIRFVEPSVDLVEDITTRYWVIATLYEAAIGIGAPDAIARWENQAKALSVPGWMQETRENQAEKLKDLLNAYQALSRKLG